MRLLKSISWLGLCGLLAFVAATAHGQQASTRVAGRIVAAKVTGTVTARNTVDGTQRALATNDPLSQNHEITTGAGASVVLVFSNGASLNLGADSTLSIDEFLQDPFATEISVAELTEEPTTSTTKVNLTRGELVGNVKRLKHGEGSTFTVNTPVGAAGIRGTTFRIVFRPDASGRVFFTLSTAEGAVLFEAPAAEGVSVETGKEVVVSVDVTVDADTGTVTINGPAEVAAPVDMPVATQTAIAVQAQEIVTAATTVIISTTTSGSSTNPNQGGGSSSNGDARFTPSNEVVPNTGPIRQTTTGDGQTL